MLAWAWRDGVLMGVREPVGVLARRLIVTYACGGSIGRDGDDEQECAAAVARCLIGAHAFAAYCVAMFTARFSACTRRGIGAVPRHSDLAAGGLAGIMWAVHPARAESVLWASCSGYVVGLPFALACLAEEFRYRGARRFPCDFWRFDIPEEEKERMSNPPPVSCANSVMAMAASSAWGVFTYALAVLCKPAYWAIPLARLVLAAAVYRRSEKMSRMAIVNYRKRDKESQTARLWAATMWYWQWVVSGCLRETLLRVNAAVAGRLFCVAAMVPAMTFILDAELEGRATDFDRLEGDVDGLSSTSLNLYAVLHTYFLGEAHIGLMGHFYSCSLSAPLQMHPLVVERGNWVERPMYGHWPPERLVEVEVHRGISYALVVCAIVLCWFAVVPNSHGFDGLSQASLAYQTVEITSAMASSSAAAIVVLAPALMSTCVNGEHQHALGLAHAARYSYAAAALMHGGLAVCLARLLSWLFDGVGADVRDAQFLGGGDELSPCKHGKHPEICRRCKKAEIKCCYHKVCRAWCLKGCAPVTDLALVGRGFTLVFLGLILSPYGQVAVRVSDLRHLAPAFFTDVGHYEAAFMAGKRVASGGPPFGSGAVELNTKSTFGAFYSRAGQGAASLSTARTRTLAALGLARSQERRLARRVHEAFELNPPGPESPAILTLAPLLTYVVDVHLLAASATQAELTLRRGIVPPSVRTYLMSKGAMVFTSAGQIVEKHVSRYCGPNGKVQGHPGTPDLERAAALYEQALSCDPGHAVASNNFGSLLMRTKCFGYTYNTSEWNPGKSEEDNCADVAEAHVLVRSVAS